MCKSYLPSPAGVFEEDLQPTRAGGNILAGVLGAPALRKADADRVGVNGSAGRAHG